MKLLWKILGVVVALAALFIIVAYFKYKPDPNPDWGLTFSYQEAQGLGFDWKTMYLDILSDLKPKHLRLMTYWNDTEKIPGEFDFTIADQMVSEAQRQNVQVVLVVGLKQPRWPECHAPEWYNALSPAEKGSAVLDAVHATVEHMKQYSNITEWQVENEPYFGFGTECGKSDPGLLKQEVSAVKALDSRPVLVTDSGDRGSWFGVARSGADNFGFTLYRVSYDENYGGYYKYPLPPAFYRIRAGMLQMFSSIHTVSDVELQMEPWFTNGALNMPVSEQRALMNPKVFADNLAYAKSTGVSAHYLWGVEWWYWMAKRNNDWGMWDAAKTVFSSE